MRHHTNELSFEQPDWLTDRTHHLLAVGDGGPSPFNIVLSRSAIEDETLNEIADRIVVELGKALDSFDDAMREHAVVAGGPALIIQFKWKQNGQQLYGRQAVIVREGPDGRTLHQIAATATDEARPRHVAAFSELLTTLRFRGDEGDGRAD